MSNNKMLEVFWDLLVIYGNMGLSNSPISLLEGVDNFAF
jgi:hypothetical protein